ncbi:hypothetical protein SAMN04488137_0175 [Fictibacillus solisalsi]|uniref:Uncharacterized protein n=1 Tax=Fictibacillus solisalsi TaxID=459525 RepID=A0A1G9TAU5_9BACL|nr:hypothetical protein [Fictibacillus solisalsi]SDM44742.1 hypothetical protein SAMN04488137_0175 [Fictibacillus solisalsi]
MKNVIPGVLLMALAITFTDFAFHIAASESFSGTVITKSFIRALVPSMLIMFYLERKNRSRSG